LPRSWPEAVFHVLAHVRGTAALPASAYDPVYVAWAERRLGPAGARVLGEDAEVLATALPTHEALASVQLLAWLFDDANVAARNGERELADVDAARPELVEPLVARGPAVEVLRCAALLEREAVERLGPLDFDASALGRALHEATRAAPFLEQASITPVRALRLRGRALATAIPDILVGAPCTDLGVDCEHAAWQAAHEATVAEVSIATDLAERRCEAVAVVLLHERAADAGLAALHARWLARLAAPSTDPATLRDEERAVVARLR
jgi:hypothetical protein